MTRRTCFDARNSIALSLAPIIPLLLHPLAGPFPPIAGFCGETEAEHADTLSLMEAVGYDMAYMFAYSERERTHAHRRMQDDVEEGVKRRRLQELVETFRRTTGQRYREQVSG